MPKTTNSRLMIDDADFTTMGASIKSAFAIIEDRLDELTGVLSATEDSDDLAVNDIVATGTLAVTGAATLTGGATIGADSTLSAGVDFALATSTGSKFGTATNQKLGFFNATPVAQQTGAAAIATTAATSTSPFGFASAAQADAIVTLGNAIRTALTNLGLMTTG